MRIPEFILFTKTERRVFYILACLLVSIYASNVFLKPKFNKGEQYTSLEEILIMDGSGDLDSKRMSQQAQVALDNHSTKLKKTKEKYKKKKWTKPIVTLSDFDPNLADSLQWISLGIHKYTVSNILKYRSKGGLFRTCDDLYRIYNLDSSYVAKLLPYCKIDTNRLPKKKSYKKPKRTIKKPVKKPRPMVDINTADTTLLKSLYGVGPYLSGAIIEERKRLGGYHSLNQLLEIYAFAPEILEDNKTRITCSGIVTKININDADLNLLKAHKYINYKTANSIIKYRKQHGPYKSIEDIKSIVTLRDSVYMKIEPYLKVN